jgi:hypothetical protein
VDNFYMIKGEHMKQCILLLFVATMVFAVQTVPRGATTDSDNKTNNESTMEESPHHFVQKQTQHKSQDRFEDADSNSVNDQREDDFQKIKKLNSKFKDKYQKKDAVKDEKNKKTNTSRGKTTK